MMQTLPLLKPRRARDDVSDVLRQLISRGDLPAGGRLEEVELSNRIGVSRTPLREALIALEAEGWLRSVPNRGVFVQPADERMVIELYPILGALEAAAVSLGGDPLISTADDLRDINRRLADETLAERQHDLDGAFHAALIGPCGNARLLGLIEMHWAQARRFDGAGRRGTADREGSCREHDAIIDAVAAGELETAAELLWLHWRRGVEVVRTWLRDNG